MIWRLIITLYTKLRESWIRTNAFVPSFIVDNSLSSLRSHGTTSIATHLVMGTSVMVRGHIATGRRHIRVSFSVTTTIRTIMIMSITGLMVTCRNKQVSLSFLVTASIVTSTIGVTGVRTGHVLRGLSSAAILLRV